MSREMKLGRAISHPVIATTLDPVLGKNSIALGSGTLNREEGNFVFAKAVKLNLGVDRNEDAKATEFQKLQCVSTSPLYPLETEAIENRRFSGRAAIRLGRRGSGVQIAPPRPNLVFIIR